ncbi:MAG: hypothetical protein JOY98_05355 [Candidatus Eremiobacteraeota bacterium]|nr:hypothetical protein [Candidatus Eremiobacteraeota bacterium]
MGPAYLVVLIVCAAFAGRLIRLPYTGALGDLYWQQQLGRYIFEHHNLPTALGAETFTAPGAPWVPQEWLMGIVVYLAMSHGALWILGLLATAALAVALLLTARRAQRFGASGTGIAICVLLAMLSVEGSFGIRAQAFAWLFFASLLYTLDLEGPGAFAALAIVVAWANVHASVMLAVPVVWIDAAVALLQRGAANAQARRKLALAALVPLATLATPLGVELPRYALMLVQSPIRHSIEEWQPISPHATFFWYGAFPLVALVVAGLRTLWRTCPRDLLWTALLLAMTVGAARNAALLAFVAAPPAALAYTTLIARLRLPQTASRVGPRRLAVAGGIVIAIVAFVWNVRAPIRPDDPQPPLATLDRVAAMPGVHRVFCYDFSVCSVALAYGNLRVFMDGRADPYPLAVWNDFNLVRNGRARWLDVLNAYGVDVVIARTGDPLDRGLRDRRDWTVQPKLDYCCRAYVRANRPLRSAQRGPNLAQRRRSSV